MKLLVALSLILSLAACARYESVPTSDPNRRIIVDTKTGKPTGYAVVAKPADCETRTSAWKGYWPHQWGYPPPIWEWPAWGITPGSWTQTDCVARYQGKIWVPESQLMP